jgi:translation initiation factor IF-3
MTRKEALEFAFSKNLDLVVVLDSGHEDMPVAKIMNYSKKLYEDKKKLNASKKKKLESNHIKELRISPKISNHDLQIKMNQGIRFLQDGCRLKVVLIMKGRERGLKDTLGFEVFQKAELMLGKATEGTGKHLVVDIDSDTMGSVCKTFYLKK